MTKENTKKKEVSEIQPENNDNENVVSMAEALIKPMEIPKHPVLSDQDCDRVVAAAQVLGITVVDPRNVAKTMNQAIKAAEHYKGEAFRIFKSKIIAGAKKVPGIVKMSWHDRLGADIKLGRTIAIIGTSGNGKSTGARAVLESAGFKVYHMDCTDSTTADQLVGGIEPVPDGKGGIGMKFKEGVFARAFADPTAAILLDEFDALDPRIALTLQSALQRGRNGKRWLSAPDHPDGGIESGGSCPVLVTMNTWGTGATREYVGRNSLDAASFDRFDTIIDTGYECEKEILMETFNMDETNAKLISEHGAKVRALVMNHGLRVIFSTRRLLDIAESMLSFGLSIEQATYREFALRLEPMDRQALGFKEMSLPF